VAGAPEVRSGIDTGGLARLTAPARREDVDVAQISKRLLRLGQPAHVEDIAEAILWLASDKARYVTGSTVTLHGGYTAEGHPGT